MPFPGKRQGLKRSGSNAPYYYTEDTGCKFSNWIGCLVCPFDKCVDDMFKDEREAYFARLKTKVAQLIYAGRREC